MAHHILHGQFVNPKVGRATICVVPMTFKWNMVKNDKGVLKAVCGNKTLKAVQRSTSSS